MTRPPAPDRIRIDGDRRSALETGRNRLIVAGALFAAIFGFIAVRTVDVSLPADGPPSRHAAEPAAGQRKAPRRADIVDRHGKLLATSLEMASLYANPRLVGDPAAAARELAAALPGLDAGATEKKLLSPGTFVWIRRHLTPREQYAVNRLGNPALDFLRETKRIYPFGALAAHVVGFADVDGGGLAGVERAHDAALRRGGTLALSLDVRAQHAVARELGAAKETFRAIGAAGLVMDVATGEVLAMVSLPAFDPHRPGAISGTLRFNRITQGVYELGSVFKIFTTAMALDSGRVRMRDSFDATRPLRRGGHRIGDYHPQKRRLTVPEIFRHSSNIGTALMAEEIGVAGHKAFLRRLGMLQPIDVGLREAGKPLVPRPWRPINTVTIAYGHGLAVSPLHLAVGVAAVVNGGVHRTPTLLRREAGRPPPGKRVISAATSGKMRRLLRLVVAKGTGRKAAAPGYFVGGKTGTAEKAGVRGYRRKALISSFVAAFPMHQPRYVVLAMLDEPKGTAETGGYATGGAVAAPVVGAIVRRVAPILGVVRPPDPERIEQALAVGDGRSSPGGMRKIATR